MIHLFDKNGKFSPHWSKWGEPKKSFNQITFNKFSFRLYKEYTSVFYCELCNRKKEKTEEKEMIVSEDERRAIFRGAGINI
ncbi:hypothetical protein KKH38_02665 [Patescibacteria group bacterium]|nr:hypothetical protein [Patescibacteria group bacterium]MBU4601026.1 hypothetical protein [Patescibacteria group bacterium]MCG2698725.1 hypothetical protein [Candidatus Parcubacteria bacterium]